MSWRTAVLAAYLLAIHAALALAAYRLTLEPPVVRMLRDTHRQQDPQVPPGAVVFLGDSITQGLAAAAVASLSINYSISGQRSDQLLKSLEQYPSLSRASAVVLTIGTNDVVQGRVADLAQTYAEILRAVPAAVPVLMNTIPPIRGEHAEGALRARAAAVEACARDARCRLVDLHAAALSHGNALAEDGVHLTESGYIAWAALLRNSLRDEGLGVKCQEVLSRNREARHGRSQVDAVMRAMPVGCSSGLEI